MGVSPDSSDKHANFIAEHELPFRLLADEDRKVMKAYGAWGKKKQYGREYEGVIRSTFLINRQGTITRVWKNVRVDGHVEKVLAEVENLE